MKSIKQNVSRSFLFIGLGLVLTTIAIARSPFEVPGRPSVPRLLGTTQNSCTIEYSAPHSDGGSPIVAYYIEHSRNWNPFWNDGGTSKELFHTVENLLEGTRYEFRVSAANAVGTGEPSDVSEYFVPQ